MVRLVCLLAHICAWQVVCGMACACRSAQHATSCAAGDIKARGPLMWREVLLLVALTSGHKLGRHALRDGAGRVGWLGGDEDRHAFRESMVRGGACLIPDVSRYADGVGRCGVWSGVVVCGVWCVRCCVVYGGVLVCGAGWCAARRAWRRGVGRGSLQMR